MIQAWWRYQNTVAELSALSDYELADLGILRFQIPVFARHGATTPATPDRARDCGGRLRAWRWRRSACAEFAEMEITSFNDIGIPPGLAAKEVGKGF
jgi:uncharacterized protein YjiS (DUF1127 family)